MPLNRIKHFTFINKVFFKAKNESFNFVLLAKTFENYKDTNVH